ncbi:MAG: D-glycerate dehydrogenase [Pseudomonadota bacterium]
MAEKPTILVTRRLPDDVEARLDRDYLPKKNAEDRPYSREELLSLAQGCDGMICTPTDKIDASLIAELPDSVRIISTISVGFDHIDLEAAKAAGRPVTHTPNVLTDATAELAFFLVLAAARRAYEGQKILRTDSWSGWAPTQLMGLQVSGKRLGVLGMGRIGQAVAKKARGFDMEIHYADQFRLPPEKEEGAVYHETPEALLGVSDFLTLHCPATPDTIKFLNAERIALMPENAIVVNTARGPVVDDDALIAALKSGRLAAAGLDVFQGEPNIHPGYRELDNAYILPHMGSATIETRNAMGFMVMDNLDAFFAGKDLPNRVV